MGPATARRTKTAHRYVRCTGTPADKPRTYVYTYAPVSHARVRDGQPAPQHCRRTVTRIQGIRSCLLLLLPLLFGRRLEASTARTLYSRAGAPAQLLDDAGCKKAHVHSSVHTMTLITCTRRVHLSGLFALA